jgi:hypothetical protein
MAFGPPVSTSFEDYEKVFKQRFETAATRLQRAWRRQQLTTGFSRVMRLYGISNTPVNLPWSANDEDLPKSYAKGEMPRVKSAAWHLRLIASTKRMREASLQGSKARTMAQLAHFAEVGKFTAACRGSAILAVHCLMLDPHGIQPSMQGSADTDVVPRRINRNDPLWSQLRPRFDGDRVFVYDSIVMTVVGGNVDARGGVDHERAWKIYKHDMAGLQALASAIRVADCQDPFDEPHVAVVQYLAFKIICRPLLGHAPGPFDLVLGPLPEAQSASGSPGDISALCRHGQDVAHIVHEWEQRNPILREDLRRLSDCIGIESYPVVVDTSDLPAGVHTTALLRTSNGELHFRTAAELLPPDVETLERPIDPTKRLRHEALLQLRPAPLPTVYRIPGAAEKLHAVSIQASHELTQKILDSTNHMGPPLDSRGWTRRFHMTGNNMRHLGRIAAAAPFSTYQALYREALARAAKWLLRKALWKRKPWALMAASNIEDEKLAGPEQVAIRELLRIFNLTLGAGPEVEKFWWEELIPEAVARFDIPRRRLDRRNICLPALFLAMEEHMDVRFQAYCSKRKFGDLANPMPFSEYDLARYHGQEKGQGLQWFPHFKELQDTVAKIRLHHAGLPITEDHKRSVSKRHAIHGFFPKVTFIGARGKDWATMDAWRSEIFGSGIPPERVEQRYQALNLLLSYQRAIGDDPHECARTMQDITTTLLDLAKATPRAQAVLFGTVAPNKRSERFSQVVWTADLVERTLTGNPISAFWSHMNALEAEWENNNLLEARHRMYRLEQAWERYAPEAPSLKLRLEDLMTRLFQKLDDWKQAAIHAKKCYELGVSAFGGVHPMSFKLHERVGKLQMLGECFSEAVASFHSCLASAKLLVPRDLMLEGRFHHGLGSALLKTGDLPGAKEHAEAAVSYLVPPYRQNQSGPLGEFGYHLALDASLLAGEVYEAIALRKIKLEKMGMQETTSFAHLGHTKELMRRSVLCFHFFLKHYPAGSNPMDAKKDSRLIRVVRDLLRLRMQSLDGPDMAQLIDAIETLLLARDVGKDRKAQEVRGITELSLRSHSRAVAASALSMDGKDDPELEQRIEDLCEKVGMDAMLGGLQPSEWFDAILSQMTSASTDSSDTQGSGEATLIVLDLFRYFGSGLTA